MSLAEPKTPGEVFETSTRFKRLGALGEDVPEVGELVEVEIVHFEHIVHGQSQDGVRQRCGHAVGRVRLRQPGQSGNLFGRERRELG